MSLKDVLTLAVQAFGTGALGWIATHATATPPASSAEWEALGFGMLVGGLGGLYHLYRPKPGGADEAALKMQQHPRAEQ